MAKNESAREWLYAGKSILFIYGNFFYWLFKEPFPYRQTGEQFIRTMLEGFGTIMIGAVVQGLFLAWLGGHYGGRFGAYIWAGTATTFAIFRETSVLMAGTLFASRVGTAFTVEIGSMQMSGQLDALRLMAVEPTQHIVIPRVLASIISLLLLKALSDGVAIISTMFFLKHWFGISYPIFLEHAFEFLKPPILTQSFVRAGIIGFFIGLNACGLGYYFQGGAIELGKTTTKSTVINFIYVLMVDLIFQVVLETTGWGTV